MWGKIRLDNFHTTIYALDKLKRKKIKASIKINNDKWALNLSINAYLKW